MSEVIVQHQYYAGVQPPRPAAAAALPFRELFAALDRCEEMLGRSRYLLGDSITEADVRLFMTLIRFDEVYVSTKVGCQRADLDGTHVKQAAHLQCVYMRIMALS
jgi:glutathionyl-hydroquinone reductase